MLELVIEESANKSTDETDNEPDAPISNEPVAASGQKETLDRLLADLQSGNEARALAAAAELKTIRFTSEAILRQLEKLALGGADSLRAAALAALNLPTSRFVYSRLSSLNRASRAMLLNEIAAWQEDGLVEPHRAEVLRRQYDFDIYAPQPEVKPAAPAAPAEVAPPAPAEVEAPKVRQVAPAQPAPAPRPAGPKPTLAQALLSETSVKIYLYLGAFLVIAAAAILAALVEAARLPVLLVATMGFAGGAVFLKKRLPQPSFALAIVFSFLLPIDANVLADTFNLSTQANDIFWTITFLLMAVIWALGTWFYQSRLFSLASYFSLVLAALRFGEIFDAPTAWNIFSVAVVNLTSLFAVKTIAKWQGKQFAQPLFLLAQVLQFALLLVSFASIFGDFTFDAAPNEFAAATLTWLFAATFFALSDLIVPFLYFPWMAAASLFLIPIYFLKIFDASNPTMIAGLAVWGALAAFGSEIVLRIKEGFKKYHFPLLALSLPLFVTALGWGFVEETSIGFAVSLGAGIAYTLINLPRPRVYVWIAALLFAISAYFTFFALPFAEKWNVDASYQMLGASLLLLLPELFFKEKLTLAREWNWPPFALGTIITGINVLTALVVNTSTGGRGMQIAFIVMGIYALLFAAYALRLGESRLVYAATASAAFSILFALDYFDKDWWLPALTALSVAYYAAGYLLARREQTKPWASPLLASGLALGALVSVAALALEKDAGGWYVSVVAILFAVEMFTRRNSLLELGLESMLSLAFLLFVGFDKVADVYLYFGASLIWLGCDLALHLSLPHRRVALLPRLFGALLALVAATLFLSRAIPDGETALCLLGYALFFSLYAWTYRRAGLGYFATAAAALALYFALDHFNLTQWLPFFAGLTLAYYAAGLLLFQKDSGWGRMFRYSGLALGVLLTLAALVQLERFGGWYVLIVGALFILETFVYRNGWFEAGVHPVLSAAAFLLLHDFKVNEFSYNALAIGLVWLVGDMLFEKLFKERAVRLFVRGLANLAVLVNALYLLTPSVPALEATVCFAAYALAYLLYAWTLRDPRIAYASTASLALTLFFGLDAARQTQWLLPLIGLASLYYLGGFFLRSRRADSAPGWDATLLYSGLGLGTMVACVAPWQSGGLEKSVPIALAATFYAAEAFARKNVWLGFPANAFYLAAYFVILNELNVHETQFFTVGAAALGLLMHYLLRRAGARRAAFITGLVSQLVLLGASYLQMVSTGESRYFYILFFQAIFVLVYGAIFMRSRSLTIAPIFFLVLAIATILYDWLKDLALVYIIGITGLILLGLGILAVVMRERITDLAERFGDWDA